MKKIIHFTLTIILCQVTILCAQNPVPNAGFENWTAGNPDDWTTNNFGPGASPVMQTTPPNSGTFAAKGEVIFVGPVSFFPLLYSTDASAAGFPVTQQYANMTFYYKTNLTGTTTFNAFVGMNDASASPIGAGAMIFAGITSTFTQATIPIFYTGSNPAECVIAFIIDDTAGVPAVGNYFIVDDVALTGTVGVEEEYLLSTAIEKVQPNPASGNTSVYFSLAETSDVFFDIYDMTGRKYVGMFLQNEAAGRHKLEWDVSGIPSGFYVLQMTAGGSRQAARLLVIH